MKSLSHIQFSLCVRQWLNTSVASNGNFSESISCDNLVISLHMGALRPGLYNFPPLHTGSTYRNWDLNAVFTPDQCS